jgi:glutathione S-transferase
MWIKLDGHPCWRVQKALDEADIAYEVVVEPWPNRRKRTAVIAATGQSGLPALELEDGTWYREDSKGMAARIRAGRLFEGGSGEESPAAS